jgi:hypothetical protein
MYASIGRYHKTLVALLISSLTELVLWGLAATVGHPVASARAGEGTAWEADAVGNEPAMTKKRVRSGKKLLRVVVIVSSRVHPQPDELKVHPGIRSPQPPAGTREDAAPASVACS